MPGDTTNGWRSGSTSSRSQILWPKALLGAPLFATRAREPRSLAGRLRDAIGMGRHERELSRAVREAFVRLYEKGLVYRGHRVIHWCPRCLTSLSDEEAEFHDTGDPPRDLEAFARKLMQLYNHPKLGPVSVAIQGEFRVRGEIHDSVQAGALRRRAKNTAAAEQARAG